MGTPAWDTLKKKASSIGHVSLDDVYIDGRFQRQVQPRQYQAIVREYHPEGVGLPLVGVVEGGDPEGSGRRYAVLDGQGRIRALWELQTASITGEADAVPGDVRAEVYGETDGGPLTDAEASLLFDLRNTKTLVTRRDKQRILRNGGNEALNRAAEQTEAAGFHLFPEGDSPATMPDVDGALSALNWGDKHDRPEFLTEVLTVMGDAYGRELGDFDADNGTVVFRALMVLMRDNPDADSEYLTSLLSARKPGRLTAEAYARKDPKAWRMYRQTSVADYIRELHNRHGAPSRLR